MCTYMNVKTGDQFDWLIGSGGTTSQFTGPSVDHTTGTKTGEYIDQIFGMIVLPAQNN